MLLKEWRTKCKMTQKGAAQFLGVSDKTYFRYEKDDKYINTLKYIKMCELLENYCKVDSKHGILTIDEIKEGVRRVLADYNVSYCYLFGSYALNKARPSSDINLLIDTKANGLKYYGLLQSLIDEFPKKVDLVRIDDINKDLDYLNAILKDGIKIF